MKIEAVKEQGAVIVTVEDNDNKNNSNNQTAAAATGGCAACACCLTCLGFVFGIPLIIAGGVLLSPFLSWM